MAGTVGPPLPSTDMRLEAVPEMKYDPTGDPPRGEILFRGPSVFSGYYRDEEKTVEVGQSALSGNHCIHWSFPMLSLMASQGKASNSDHACAAGAVWSCLGQKKYAEQHTTHRTSLHLR